MEISSRDVARHLYRYAAFLRSEAERANALDFLDDERSGEVEREAEEVREMANILYELKERIYPSKDSQTS